MTILAVTGPIAFSDFRIANIVSELSSKINVSTDKIAIDSSFIHYIELSKKRTIYSSY